MSGTLVRTPDNELHEKTISTARSQESYCTVQVPAGVCLGGATRSGTLLFILQQPARGCRSDQRFPPVTYVLTAPGAPSL
jgi:hypothetical protein